MTTNYKAKYCVRPYDASTAAFVYQSINQLTFLRPWGRISGKYRSWNNRQKQPSSFLACNSL